MLVRILPVCLVAPIHYSRLLIKAEEQKRPRVGSAGKCVRDAFPVYAAESIVEALQGTKGVQ